MSLSLIGSLNRVTRADRACNEPVKLTINQWVDIFSLESSLKDIAEMSGVALSTVYRKLHLVRGLS